jgi:hypothetical protein
MTRKINTWFGGSLLGALLAIVLIAFILSIPIATSGCLGESQGQVISANATAAGEAVGAYLLRQNTVGGVVSPTYLASYVAEAPKIGNVMAGAVTPADLHALISNAKGVVLSNAQSEVVAYLDGLSPEFIAVNGTANGQPPTQEGALADAAAKQFASGLEAAVGFVTGTNYAVPTPTPSPSTTMLLLNHSPLAANGAPDSALPYQETPYRFEK